MIDKDKITLHEAGNDGRTLFLYYDGMAGLYLAFGLSAYYSTMVAEPYLSYSDELQMPVALLLREHILQLRQGLMKEAHEPKHYYRFRMKAAVGDAGYARWAQKVRGRHDSITR